MDVIIPLFLSMEGCPFHCVYCDQGAITGDGKGLTPEGVRQRIDETLTHLPTGANPPEAAFFGGTFTALPWGRQQELLEAVSPFLERGRIGSIRLSTRPDAIEEQLLDRLWQAGVRTIELGVQSLSPRVLQESRRGYGPQVVVKNSRLIKEKGFRLGIQLMLGLPGDTRALALATARETVRLRPDFVRVYPALVFRGTALEQAYRKGEYRPWNLGEAVAAGADMMGIFARQKVPVARWGLQAADSLTADLTAGPWHPAYGELVRQEWLFRLLEKKLGEYRRGGKGSLPGRTLRITCPAKRLSLLTGHGRRPLRRLQGKWESLQNWEIKTWPGDRWQLEIFDTDNNPRWVAELELEFLKSL